MDDVLANDRHTLRAANWPSMGSYFRFPAAKYGIKVWWICDSVSNYPGKLPGGQREANQGARSSWNWWINIYFSQRQNSLCWQLFFRVRLGKDVDLYGVGSSKTESQTPFICRWIGVAAGDSTHDEWGQQPTTICWSIHHTVIHHATFSQFPPFQPLEKTISPKKNTKFDHFRKLWLWFLRAWRALHYTSLAFL